MAVPEKTEIPYRDNLYELANGSLFLISFRSPQIRVVQINQGIYAMMPKGEARKLLVEDVPEIRAFYEAPATE